MTTAPAFRTTRRRRGRTASGVVAAVLTVALGGTGCAALTGDTGSDELQQFLSALEAGDVAGAAAMTTDPAAAEETLARAGFDGTAADQNSTLPANSRRAMTRKAAGLS